MKLFHLLLKPLIYLESYKDDFNFIVYIKTLEQRLNYVQIRDISDTVLDEL